ncbi:MAG: helix-turn-helix transcriptional regulator, partial [Verrucomicrobiota bacterium]
MSSTAATADFTSARNPKGKAPSTAALRNEGQRINIPYDAKAWDHIKHLSPQDRDALGDFHLQCLHRQLTSGQVAELLGYEKSNVTRILTGQYQPQSASVWEKILNNIRAQDQAHLPIVHIGGVDHEPEFVETNASQRYLLALE